ncbi:MAG: phosphoglycerate dehydrogenase [Cyclobacteriaceae bacterium]|nr:MAG: phosphoglycerate dehydrogenase [Cyclobacteriaceae bacterium]
MASNLDTDFETRVRNISNQITLLKDLQGQSQLEALNQADIHFGQIKKEQFGQTKNLSWVQSVSAGVEHQLYPEFKDSEVVLTNAKGCYAPAIAEHTIGLLFSLTRQIGSQVRRMSEHQWGGSGDQIEMKNLTMGIVGFGGIGRQVARRARAMDMRILAADIQGFYKEQIGDICDELYHISEGGLEDLLEQSDVVVCAAPHTPVSEGMFGEKQFERMKSGAYFINVSRGKLVDTDALQAALESGHLAGAGLDVTNPEPLPAEHPLWDFENVTITSHISGRSQHSWERLQAVFVENVNRYINGQPLINTVDKEAGF